MPLYITVDNRCEANPAGENYKSNVMYAKYYESHLFNQSHVKTTFDEIKVLENRPRLSF